MLPDSEPEIIGQWLGRPYRENGEPFRVPTAAISHVDDRLAFYDSRKISTSDSFKRGGSVELREATLDQWIDVFFRLRWDHSGNGYLEINRKDRVPGARWQCLIKQNGVSIGYHNASDPIAGIGSYKHDAGRRYQAGKSLSHYYQRRVYFDEFYVGSHETTTGNVALRDREVKGTEQLELRYNDKAVGELVTLGAEFKESYLRIDNPTGNFKVAFIN